MSEAESDETVQDEDLIPSEGYSMGAGAPPKPTRADLYRGLMLADINKACALAPVPHISDDPLVALHTLGLWVLNVLQVVLDEEKHDHDCLERIRQCGEGIVRWPRLAMSGDAE